jgi:hypothetical protein
MMKIWEQGKVSRDCSVLYLNGDLFSIELVVDKAYELMTTNIEEVIIEGRTNRVSLTKDVLIQMKKKKTESLG